MPLEITSLQQNLTANVTLVHRCAVRQRVVIVVLGVESDMLVEIAGIAESAKTVSAL